MMKLITYKLLMILLWIMVTIPSESQAKIVGKRRLQCNRKNRQELEGEKECGTGEVDESYCDPPRCPCQTEHAVCTDNRCDCDTGYTDVDGVCLPVIPDGYVQMEGLPGYLKVVSDAKTWEEARSDCQDDDALGRTDLVSIDSQQKNDEVLNDLLTASLGYAWIGLKQKTGEQWKYEWMSGVELTAVAGELASDGNSGKPYRNFYQGSSIDETGRDNSDCLVMYTNVSPNGRWDDWPCSSSTAPSVCELIP